MTVRGTLISLPTVGSSMRAAASRDAELGPRREGEGRIRCDIPGEASIDIDAFYQSDPRRRSSPERSYGLDWRDQADAEHLYDLGWVADTGELYLLRKPRPPAWFPVVTREDLDNFVRTLKDLAHDVASVTAVLVERLHPRHARAKTITHLQREDEDAYDEELLVEVLAVISSAEEVEAILGGWEEHVSTPDGLAWVRDRLAGRAAAGRGGEGEA
jgi:hypothetical protein